MRLIVINQDHDLQTLSSKLFGTGSKSGDEAVVGKATFERIKLLNPHVDFQHIEIGTVLLLPDVPELNESDSQSIFGDAFTDFADHVASGLEIVAQRMKTGTEALTMDRMAVTDTLKTAAVRRQIESDPLFEKQLNDAREQHTDEQNEARDAAKQLGALQGLAAQELEALGKTIR